MGTETQGIKGVKFQGKMTVLASRSKGKYLSLITGTSHLAIRIPVKFIDFYPASPGTFTFLDFQIISRLFRIPLPGLLPSAGK